MLKSWTPPDLTTGLMCGRLQCSDPLLHEVVMMECWEAANTKGWLGRDQAPVFAIIHNYLAKSTGELFLPGVPWERYVSPDVLGRVSATVHWSSTNTGKLDYNNMRKAGLTTAAQVRQFARKKRNCHQGELEVVINETMHHCGPGCGQVQWFSFETRPYRPGVLVSRTSFRHAVEEAPEYAKQIFYHTVAWLLSPAGQKFYDGYLGVLAHREKAAEELRHVGRMMAA